MSKVSIITVCFLLWIGLVNAQISLDRIKNHAKQSVEQAIEKKINTEIDKMAEKTVDKYWDRVLGKYYQGSASATVDENGAKTYPFKMNTDVKTKNVYRFDGMVKMKMDTYKKNGKVDETIYIKTLTNANENYIGTNIIAGDKRSKEAEDMLIINDFDNEAMVMLTESDGEKISVAFGMDLDSNALMDAGTNTDAPEDIESIKYENIGTKRILGYSCTGYRIVDESVDMEMWISDEPIPGAQAVAKMLSQQQKKDLPANYPNGTMLETTVETKDSKDKFRMQVVEINPDFSATYNMSDYPNTMQDPEDADK